MRDKEIDLSAGIPTFNPILQSIIMNEKVIMSDNIICRY